MPEDKCNHWYKDSNEDNTEYWCRDCLHIMEKKPVWHGTVDVGKGLSKRYQTPRTNESLNLAGVLRDLLGTNKVSIEEVFGLDDNSYWEKKVVFLFSIGNASGMTASVSYATGDEFVETPKIKKLEPVAVPDAE